MTELDTGLPSVRQVQSYIQDKKGVEVKLTTGDVLAGQIVWQDPNYFRLVNGQQESFLLYRPTVVYIKG
ncbi:MAG: RNA-binding protein hfq [Gloeomargarita sp. HHBFW_bins_162]